MDKKLLEEYLEKIKDATGIQDTEYSHEKADKVLCELLIKLGYGQVVEIYNDRDKWYA